MESFKNFLIQYRGAIIGILIAILILCTQLYRLIIAIILIVIGGVAGNYIQQIFKEKQIKIY